MGKSTPAILLDLLRPFGRVAAGFLVVMAVLVWWRFPRQMDPAMPERRIDGESYYEAVYGGGGDSASATYDDYARIADLAAREHDIVGTVSRFVGQYELGRSKVLEVGAGRGRLQDLVEDYTGLDIAESSRRFFRKKFVRASATAIPFADEAFDAAWSIWVLEHVPNPEHALVEMRRVLKSGGLLLLMPAFECDEWLADGYQVRPYSDLSWTGKIYKASLPGVAIVIGYATPFVRMARSVERWAKGSGPSRYRYRLLQPNYRQYWQADSDALNHLDYHETVAWFESRGDECLNCGGLEERLITRHKPLIIRVRKALEKVQNPSSRSPRSSARSLALMGSPPPNPVSLPPAPITRWHGITMASGFAPAAIPTARAAAPPASPPPLLPTRRAISP